MLTKKLETAALQQSQRPRIKLLHLGLPTVLFADILARDNQGVRSANGV
ncbi:MAG TPA: hypothetical protein VMG10_28855 [Gemmataceae bacterium]|nr:hypothetical protein [Gemmataceae bacterium]